MRKQRRTRATATAVQVDETGAHIGANGHPVGGWIDEDSGEVYVFDNIIVQKGPHPATVIVPADAEYLTVAQTATLLQISYASCLTGIKEGTIPAVRVGDWRVNRMALAAKFGGSEGEK